MTVPHTTFFGTVLFVCISSASVFSNELPSLRSSEPTLERGITVDESRCANKVVDANGMGLTRKVLILSKPNPPRTQKAIRRGTVGVVLLELVLSSEKTVKDIRVVQGLQDGLTEAAVGAARKIRFEPALRNGCPVSQSFKVEYEFFGE